MEPTFFATPAKWRAWLERYHDKEKECLVGLIRAGSAKKGISYAQALDEALSYGWIDGVRRSIDDETWMIRFTPRTPRSIWSAVNLKHVERLTKEGRMHPAGLATFEGRDPERQKLYSFENRDKAKLNATMEKTFRADPEAWAFWQKQPDGYHRVASYWVVSAKKEETRQRRLTTLIADSAAGRRIPSLSSPAKKKKTEKG